MPQQHPRSAREVSVKSAHVEAGRQLNVAACRCRAAVKGRPVGDAEGYRNYIKSCAKMCESGHLVQTAKLFASTKSGASCRIRTAALFSSAEAGTKLGCSGMSRFRIFGLKQIVQTPSPITALGVKAPHLQFLRVSLSNPTPSTSTSLNSRQKHRSGAAEPRNDAKRTNNNNNHNTNNNDNDTSNHNNTREWSDLKPMLSPGNSQVRPGSPVLRSAASAALSTRP